MILALETPIIIAIIVAVIVILLLVFFFSGFVKAAPDTAIIITGLGKRKILIGKQMKLFQLQTLLIFVLMV